MNTQYQENYQPDFTGFYERTREMIAEPTKETPFVKYSRNENIFMVKGSSLRQDSHHFYHPFISGVKAHINEGRELDVLVFFNMINTSTVKVLFDLFKFLRKASFGTKVKVTWYVEADNYEMYETGRDFSEVYDLNIKFITI